MDFVIVGGGIYGCGVAWELARRGGEVLLLEATTIASGASGGKGKRGVRANGRDLRELPLMRRAYDLWPDLHQAIDAPTGYIRSGHLLLMERDRDLDAAPALAWMQEQQGIPTQVLEQGELRERDPHVSSRIIAALYCPQDGVADHTATTKGMAQAAQKLGAEIREQTTVTGIERKGERVSAVITSQGERFPVGKMLFLLANSAVPGLLQDHFAVHLPIWARLPQVILTAPLDSLPFQYLIGHAHRRLALKTLPDKSVMISGGWTGRWNAKVQCGETRTDQIVGNLQEAITVYPSLNGVKVLGAAADRLETETIDQIPIIDRVPGATNALFAAGWSGHGWAIAPAVTELLADWAQSGERPALLQPFAYDRFSSYLSRIE